MMPGTYPLIIYRADDHAWRFVLWQDAAKSVPVDLTGVTVAAEVRDRPAGASIFPLALTVTLPNIIDAELDHDITAQLPASGRWDLQLTDPAGWVSTILAGGVTVTGDITDSSGEPAAASDTPAPARRRAGYLVEG
jgi:hypothetical protein